MNEGMEWRPTKARPERKTNGRRLDDGDLGERMARVEERLHAVETACEGVESAIIRVHERVDTFSRDMNDKFGELQAVVYSRLSEANDDMDRRLATHVADEEKLFAARFDTVLTKITGLADSVASERAENKDRMNKAVKVASIVLGAFIAVVVPLVGYFAGQVLGHLPEIARLVELMEKAK